MKLFRSSILAVILTGSCFAQTASTPKFESRSRLVIVPVKVTDAKGLPVTNLTQADFTIVSDGKPQQIASFEGPVPADAATAPASEPSNPLEFNNITDKPPRHVTVIAFDPQNTPTDERAQAVKSVLKFLASKNAPDEPIELVSFRGSGVQIIHDFSSDREALARSLKATNFWADTVFSAGIDITGNIANSLGSNETQNRRGQKLTNDMQREQQSMTNDSTSDTQSDALATLATTLVNIPGQKGIVWITHGFELKMDTPTMGTLDVSANSGHGTRLDLWANTFRNLNSANISIYPVDSRGLTTLNDMADKSDMDILVSAHPDLGGARSQAQHQSNERRLSAVGWIADETNGRAFFNTNNISGAIVDAVNQSSSSYMLSFRVPSNAKKGWHPVQVKVVTPDTHVQAKAGFVIEEPKKGKDDKTLENAMLSAFPVGNLPLMMRWTSSTEAKDKAKRIVKFDLAVVPGALDLSGLSDPRLSLQIRAVARNLAEKPVAGAEKKIDMPLDASAAAKLTASGFSYSGAMELEPGEYNVTFGVQDLVTQRVGTVKAVLRLAN